MNVSKIILFYSIVILTAVAFVSFRAQKKKVLIIGDSISIGYTPFVREALQNEADVIHNPGNAQHTGTGLKNIDKWLGNTHWDVIHFNWGLWDLAYRNSESKNQGNRDKINGRLTYTVDQYRRNLDTLVQILKATGARLIFATTTLVPPGEIGRYEGDERKYNQAALEIMKKYCVEINDLNNVSYAIHKMHAMGAGDVHYTKEGYELLAQPVVVSIRKVLRENKILEN